MHVDRGQKGRDLAFHKGRLCWDRAAQSHLGPFGPEMYQPVLMTPLPQGLHAAEGRTCKVLMRLPFRYKGKLTKLLYFVTTSGRDTHVKQQ